MRLILHAGTHKTGTTSIQHVLAANGEFLRERGYIYTGLYGRHHNHFAHRIAMAEPQELDQLRDELLGNGDPDRTLIMSAEEFSARIIGTRDWEDFDASDYWQKRFGYLERLRNIVRDFDEVTVLLCFRRQDQYAESLYATKLQSASFHWSFEEFRSRCAPIFDYRAQLKAFHTVFCDVRVKSFDTLKPDLVPNFLRWLSVPIPADANVLEKVTPDARLIYWLHRKTTPTQDRHDRRLRGKFCRSSEAHAVLKESSKTSLWKSDEERRRFLDQCTDPEPGFFRQPEMGGTVYAVLDTNELNRLDDAFSDWRWHQKTEGAPRKKRKRRRVKSIIRSLKAAFSA